MSACSYRPAGPRRSVSFWESPRRAGRSKQGRKLRIPPIRRRAGVTRKFRKPRQRGPWAASISRRRVRPPPAAPGRLRRALGSAAVNRRRVAHPKAPRRRFRGFPLLFSDRRIAACHAFFADGRAPGRLRGNETVFGRISPPSDL